MSTPSKTKPAAKNTLKITIAVAALVIAGGLLAYQFLSGAAPGTSEPATPAMAPEPTGTPSPGVEIQPAPKSDVASDKPNPGYGVNRMIPTDELPKKGN